MTNTMSGLCEVDAVSVSVLNTYQTDRLDDRQRGTTVT